MDNLNTARTLCGVGRRGVSVIILSINLWRVFGRYYPLARVVWCRRHATCSDTRTGCPLLRATASASSPGDPTVVSVEPLNATRGQGRNRVVTINIWRVFGQYYPLARVVWCRRHATCSDTRAGCPLLRATASASSPGDPTDPACRATQRHTRGQGRNYKMPRKMPRF